MLFTKKSPFSGKTHTMNIDVTAEQLYNWKNGMHIQHAMRNVSADDREFIMTGITPKEWDEAFSNNEDYDRYDEFNDEEPF